MIWEMFLVSFFIALGLLGLGIAVKNFLPSLMSTIMFAVLMMYSFDIETEVGGVLISDVEPLYVGLSLVFMLIALLVTFLGMIEAIREMGD